MSALLSIPEPVAQAYDMTTAGDNKPDNARELSTALLSKAWKDYPETLAHGYDDKDSKLGEEYFRRQSYEDTTSLDRKWANWRKRHGMNPTGNTELTPNELVQEAFGDVRNPKSRF
jgi:hypothetical protein